MVKKEKKNFDDNRFKPRIRILFSRIFLSCLSLLFFLLVLNSPFMSQGLRNITLVYFVRTIMSPVSELVIPDLITTPEFFSILSQKNSNYSNPYLSRLDGIAQLMKSDPYSQLYEGRMALERASEFDHNSIQRKELLQRAIATGADVIQIEAYLILAQSMSIQGDIAGYENQMEAVANFLSPLIMQTNACSGWDLQGVFIDTRELVIDQPVHLALIWQQPNSRIDDYTYQFGESVFSADRSWKIWTWHNYLFQIGIIPNMVSDGGFEHAALPFQGLSKQFPVKIYGQEGTNDSALVYEYPHLSKNMTLRLNGGGILPVGVSTTGITFPKNEQDTAYLVIGRFRSDDFAKPFIGVRWLLEGSKEFGDNISSYVVAQPSLHWRSFAGLFVPPDESYGLQYWIYNADPSSDLKVDDVGLWRVPLPCGISSEK